MNYNLITFANMYSEHIHQSQFMLDFEKLGCIYLIKNAMKAVILRNMITV